MFPNRHSGQQRKQEVRMFQKLARMIFEYYGDPWLMGHNGYFVKGNLRIIGDRHDHTWNKGKGDESSLTG